MSGQRNSPFYLGSPTLSVLRSSSSSLMSCIMFVFSVKVRVAIAFSLVVFVGLLDIRYAQYHAYVASYLLVGSFGISFRLKNIRLTWSSSKRGMKIFLERRPTPSAKTQVIENRSMVSMSLSVFFFFFPFFFLAYFHFPASGQPVVTGGVIPSPPRFLPSIFVAHRAHQSHCSSIVHRMLLTHALALSASQFVHKKKSQRIYTSMHSAGLELTKLTYYTRLEDNLIRHRGDRFSYTALVYFCPHVCLWSFPAASA